MCAALSTTPTPGRVADLHQAARGYVQRAIGHELDTSEESLAFVDHYVGTVRGAGELNDEVMALLAAALGVHLGEVAIAKYGGSWRGPLPPETGDPDDPATWRVELGAAPLAFDPVGMAAESLRLGDVEGYDAGLHTRPDLTAPLLEGLSRAAPVSDEYYYSLTGRFETIAYAVDLLTEMLHQRETGTAAPEPDELN
jgi:hypothetical protein